jgi:NhaP-type Na+/H+ or K+/H+ antiporter
MIAATAIQAIFILLLPLGVVYLCKRIKWFRFLGPLLLCYILGLLIGTLPIGIQKDVASLISEISIVLAIPLILFNCDFIRWLSSSNKTVLSFSLLVISVAVVSFLSSISTTDILYYNFTLLHKYIADAAVIVFQNFFFVGTSNDDLVFLKLFDNGSLSADIQFG